MDEAPSASVQLLPEWKLVARDAFNGVILWKRGIPLWQTHLWPLKAGPATIPRRLVAVGERGGGVDQMLQKISAYYDVEIEHQQQVLLVTTYFVSFILMAITVGIIVIAFLSGYWLFALSAGEW